MSDFVVGIQFRPAGKIYTFVTNIADLLFGEMVTVEGEGGVQFGLVAATPRQPSEEEKKRNYKRVLSRPTLDEMAAQQERAEEAMKCFKTCVEKIMIYNLPIKLVHSDLIEGSKKVVFTFFAEERVDFRALVKDLASTLKKRVEMRQIGARDASKFIGCFGPCGRTTCCSTHIREFQPISVAMAKNQCLSPNPTKLAGMCNKLKCCLFYENETYIEMRKGLPKIGKIVETPHGRGKISNLNVLKKLVMVRFEEEKKEMAFSPDQVKVEKVKKEGDEKKK